MTTTPRGHWWIGLALLAAGAAMAFVFGGPRRDLAFVPRPREDTNVLRVAYVQNLLPDPHRRTSPMPTHNHFILSLWEPLVECDPATGEPRPAAAESWAWSADRKVLTLKLRPDGRWSNGDPVTAQDFVRSWQRLLHQSVEVAQTLFSLKNAEAFHRGEVTDPALLGMRAVDDRTLRLEVAQLRLTLVAELADPLLSPLHESTERVLKDAVYFTAPDRLVTNGPFRLAQATADGYRLRACPYYHGRAHVRLAGVHFIRASSLMLAPALLAAGVVDLLSPTPWEEYELPTRRPVQRELELVLSVTSLYFNVTRGPLQDLRVRRALALALDRAGPADRMNPGRMVPARGWVPGMPGREGLTLWDENPVEARRLLAAAGYPDGRGFPVLTMSLPLWMQTDPYPAIWAEQWFQELGVKTHLIYEPVSIRSLRMAAGGDYDVAYGTLVATVPDAGDMMLGFMWPAENNDSKWHDDQMAGFLTEANATTGAKHLAALAQAERRLASEVPAVPVMFERRQAMLAGEVQGWYDDPLARQSLKRLWLAPAAPGEQGGL